MEWEPRTTPCDRAGANTQWDRRLDGRIAQALMSIPAVKVWEIGRPLKTQPPGSKVMMRFLYKGGDITEDQSGRGLKVVPVTASPSLSGLP